MNTVCAYLQSSAGVCDRCHTRWSRNFVCFALLLSLCLVGCGVPSSERTASASSPQAVAAATASAQPDSSAGAVASSTPVRHTTSAMVPTPVGSSPTPAVISIPTPADTTTWQRYHHDEYGVSLQYPSCFAALEPWLRPVPTSASLVTVSAPVIDRQACPVARFLVELTPLAAYQFTSMGVTYGYDATTDTWLQQDTHGSRPYAPSVMQGPGWTGSIFGDGDAGFTYYAVAIPCQAQQVMVEIGFVSDDPTSDVDQQRALEHAILATVQC